MHRQLSSGTRSAFLALTMVASQAVVGCGGPVAHEREAEAPAPPPPLPASKHDPEPVDDGPEKVSLPDRVRFKKGTPLLVPESDEALAAVKQFMRDNPDVTKLRIEGHTDSDHDEASNMRLSKRRAMAAARWLIAKGIDCRRLLPIGYGETDPLVDPERSAEDKAKNRRVDFVVAGRKGRRVRRRADGGSAGEPAGNPCR